jgi:predicted TIM-barrel fold metal-dependent hydrolase
MTLQPGNALGFDLPILDAHHHFWNLSDGHFPWLTDEYDDTFFLGDYRRMCHDFLPPQYRAATAGFDVIGPCTWKPNARGASRWRRRSSSRA